MELLDAYLFGVGLGFISFLIVLLIISDFKRFRERRNRKKMGNLSDLSGLQKQEDERLEERAAELTEIMQRIVDGTFLLATVPAVIRDQMISELASQIAEQTASQQIFREQWAQAPENLQIFAAKLESALRRVQVRGN